jgi:hypothetical protein
MEAPLREHEEATLRVVMVMKAAHQQDVELAAELFRRRLNRSLSVEGARLSDCGGEKHDSLLGTSANRRYEIVKRLLPSGRWHTTPKPAS